MTVSEHHDVSNDDYLLDQPIGKGKDLLGYGDLAVALANTIIGQPNNFPLTVGIDGPWGSGKSSILRLLLHELQEARSKSVTRGLGLVVVAFSPWLISNRTALVSEFFEQLDKAIGAASRKTRLIPSLKSRDDLSKWFALRKRSVTKNIRSARKTMSRFAGLATLASTAVAAVDPTLNTAVVANVSRRIGGAIKPGERSLEQLKTDLVHCLQQIAKVDSSFRIVVFVDDLDRLEPEDSLEVLRLVKAVADFPAIIYLLAYDRHALSTSISKSSLIDDGNAYLEKIVQFSFKVPPLEPFKLRKWLREEIDTLFPDQISDKSPRTQIVLDVWAGRLLRTPRDVKRLLFAVRTMWHRLESRADLLDLVWLQMVKEKAASPEADLYTWIARYLQSLDALAIGGRVSGTVRDQQDLVKILKALGWREYRGEEGMDSIDFHHLDSLLAGVTQSSLDDSSMTSERWTHRVETEELGQFREGRRLASPWHWRLYYALDHPSHAVTDDEWTALKDGAEVSEDELGDRLRKLLDLGAAVGRDVGDQVMSRIIFDAKNGLIKNPINWLRAVVSNAVVLSELSKMERQFGFDKEFDVRIKVLVREIFRASNTYARSEMVESLFCQKGDLGMSAAIVREQFAASTEGDSADGDTVYLTPEELKTAVACQVCQFKLLEPDTFRGISSPYDVLYAWKEVTGSSQGAEELLNTASETEEGLLDMLEALKYVSSSEQNNVPHVPAHFLRHFMDVHAAKSRLESIAGEKSKHTGRAQELLNVWWSGS